MSLLSRLERVLGRFAVPHLTLALIVCQVVTYAVCYGIDQQPGWEGREPAERTIALIPDRVLDGQVWRLVTFLLLPPTTFLVFAVFVWYLFFLMGTALEAYWGTFRYNLYLLVWYVATVAAAFLTPDRPTGNAFLEASVFLAFAWLNPEFPIALFFVLLVPIKWIARVTWAGIILTVVVGPWPMKAQAVAAVVNFLIFFGRDIVAQVRTGQRRMAVKAAALAIERPKEYHHRCRVCGLTDQDDRQMEFRYCSKCVGQCCYCRDHLKAHEHVTTP